jgi:CIC family chloride channel protein
MPTPEPPAELPEAPSRLAERLGEAILTGLLAGGAASAFHWVVEVAGTERGLLRRAADAHPLVGGAAAVVGSAALVALAAWLVQRFEPDAVGSGIPTVKEVLRAHRPLAWHRVFWVKFLSGTLAIAAGLALGREGPTVQMGGSLGQGLARGRRGGVERERTLLVLGSGAGLAAAFNAPLAGVFFVIEELRVSLRPRQAIAALIATSTAVWLGRSLFGQAPVFSTPGFAPPPLSAYPLFVVLGLVMGGAGVLFNRSLLATMGGMGRLRARWGAAPVAALAGALVGLTGAAWPGLLGPGERLINHAVEGGLAWRLAAGVLLVRFALTLVSYGSATAGGLFAPVLVLGAHLGLVSGHAAGALLPGWAGPAGTWAVVGMSSLLAASVRSPVTAVVLMIEMTESYALAMPLLLASLAAYVVADALGDVAIYDALLERAAPPRHPTPPPSLPGHPA